jgi:membrane protein implicated in regulation of membrane protease activity
MAEEREPEEPEEPKKEPSKTTLSGKELIILIIFAPVVFTWLFLAARIVMSATTSQNVLENIEPLLTALAILTVPVSMGLQKLFEGVGDKEDKDKK